MLLFGHLGIGLRLARIVRPASGLRAGGVRETIAVLAGTVIPDLVDKSVYYGLSLATGRTSADLGLISCTRTFGHSGLFLAALAMAAAFSPRGRPARAILFAIAVGVLTHHLLDFAQDFLYADRPFLERAETLAFLYPLSGRFAAMQTHSAAEHLAGFLRYPGLFVVEAVGIVYLLAEWRQIRRPGVESKA